MRRRPTRREHGSRVPPGAERRRPGCGRVRRALADYYDDQICALVARLEGEEPPLLAQIRSEAFSSRIISVLHAIERTHGALAE